jgi:hypothetical protein
MSSRTTAELTISIKTHRDVGTTRRGETERLSLKEETQVGWEPGLPAGAAIVTEDLTVQRTSRRWRRRPL